VALLTGRIKPTVIGKLKLSWSRSSLSPRDRGRSRHARFHISLLIENCEVDSVEVNRLRAGKILLPDTDVVTFPCEV